VKHAKQEGIDFQVLTNPVEFLDDGRGWLRAARCVRMELGEPDASGRRRPIPIAGSEFEVPLSVAIIATGTSANPLVQSTTPGLKTNKRGYIEADGESQRTSRKGVFAGGDIVTGSATVIPGDGSGETRGESDARVFEHGRVVARGNAQGFRLGANAGAETVLRAMGKCLTTFPQLKPKKAKRLMSELKLRPPGLRSFIHAV